MSKLTTYTTKACDDAIASTALCMILQEATSGEAKGDLYRATHQNWCIDDAVLHIALLDGNVVGGCVTLGNNNITLSSLAVQPEAYGNKIGVALMEEVISHYNQRNASVIQLIVRTTLNGLPEHAVALYREFGFRMLPGIFVNAIKWALVSSHLWDTCDPDGDVFRNRIMQLRLKGGHHNG